ncbi:MAG TPA: alpha-amylase family glycosyl hydrolase [Candidatus Acidoferrales bacterium]|nr:alpha-amylase family glycosyl hydrolase [Candidatus Acidoferrales bacterium]
MHKIFLISTAAFLIASSLYAQDSVDVTFYFKPTDNPTVVYLPGEFNNWANNNQGVIAPGSPTAMTKDAGTGIWSKTYRLKVEGPQSGGGVAGAYQYKINENGTSNGWLPDPLNPYQNSADNNNSMLYVKSPTVFHFLPNSKSGIVSSQQPVISAYIFPSLASAVDTSSFMVQIDAVLYKIAGAAYNPATNFLSFLSPISLQNGTRTMKLSVKNLAGNLISDSTSFVVEAGAIQILNQGGHVTVKPGTTILGVVEDTSVHNVEIVQNGTDTIGVPANDGNFSFSASYTEGLNTFVAVAKDSSGATIVSSPFTITYLVNHSPNAVISFSSNGNSITLFAGNSTDPDPGESALLTFAWGVDPSNPSVVNGVQGSTSSSITVPRPSKPGEYYFSLIATDSSGNKDTTRSYFTIDTNDSVTFPTYASNPLWAKMGRIYEIFFNSFTPQQTINAATQKLDYLQEMGFNIIWVMPVMKNNQPIDNSSGTGYNIVDFYTVAPQYGTNADFKDFVDRAHQLGMKVILDVTPNQTSYNHPFVNDARLFKTYSFYWGFYQHQLITNSNYHPNFSESITSDGFVYYSGFSDQLLNYNWSDLDSRTYMEGVYKWWVQQMGLDGYRFDSYWGPHDRADNGNGGENEMGTPTRTLLKHIKPDIFFLGETAGTGTGTEVNYADDGGGLDAAYDWNMLHNAVQSFNFGSSSSVSNLNNYVTNGGGASMGFTPGPNALFMRGMENHDEDRIAYTYGSYAKTMPMGTVIFTIPGIPMLYSGQEVGWGLGISDFDQRRRGVIDWNSAGKSLLTPHYQRLAWIRATFAGFSTQTFDELSTGNGWVYGYTRPYVDQNGIALENFGGSPATASITLVGSGNSPNVYFAGGAVDGKTYYMNDVYNDSSSAVTFSGGSLNLSVTLPAYGSAVYVLSDSLINLAVPTSVRTGDLNIPERCTLEQNYPNPFNPTTVIGYQLSVVTHVTLKVYDVLGRSVATLVNEKQGAGTHVATFDGSRLSSGVYFYRLQAGAFTDVKKLMLMK